ncbi:hypothetical protein [Rhizobium sp. 007]|uniref:hypothetical protein n=1 Tax=Rhizobium sp. 007 TaxID=2785056 RepID=UPI00188F5E60|nr:hypothetical protein [Rhizobium sp. 007]QPB24505.1 hypothetical protein ISN39_33750 [Rhizobium sp. 007]
MTESADLDRMAQEVRKAAEECGAMILETILASENLPAVAVDGDTFPSLVKHLRPKLIYMVLTKFEATEDVESHFEQELDRDLKKLASKWKAKDGQSARLVLGLVADGVLHGIVETADWFDEFDIEADELAEARQQAEADAFARLQEADAKSRETEEKKRLAPIVKKLLADPRFVASKISAAKRLTLAETLFPEESRTTLRKAVDQAANEVWLASPASNT